MSVDRLSVLIAYADALHAKASLRTRADIERRQRKLWRRLAPALAKTPALAKYVGASLSDFPMVEPTELRTRPGAWNSLGLSAEEIEAAASDSEQNGSGALRAHAPSHVVAGYSTGSTGARGMFLSSGVERAHYLGQSLAKLAPNALLRRRRIGLCLRANNALYRDVAKSGPISFRYFPLATAPATLAKDLEAFAPDIFIAPSHVLVDLAALAESGAFKPRRFERIFYGGEPMAGAERVWIAQALGARPDPIYQATEGFLGAACAHGTLHLNEDSIHVELEPLGGSNRFRPIITDLRRTSQPMVRVRLDDLIQVSQSPCACGSPLLGILPIEGRVSDIWRWGAEMIFPRDVEEALESAQPPAAHWRATASPTRITLTCDPAHADTAQEALSKLLTRTAAPSVHTIPFEPDRAPKRRRVRWSHG